MPSPRNRKLVIVTAVVVLLAGGGAALRDMHQERRDLQARAEAVTGGNVHRGQAAFNRYGCGGCHEARGVPQAQGRVGPPLTGIGARAFVGGKLQNTPDNLRRWIEDPQSVTPGSAMPDLGVRPGEARDIAAFLYTIT